LLKAVFGVAQ